MKYFIDLDNTLCETTNSDYKNSIPIEHRIKYVNNLKIDGHHVTIWTARGAKSGVNHEEITKKQLKEIQEIEKKVSEVCDTKKTIEVYRDENGHIRNLKNGELHFPEIYQ